MPASSSSPLPLHAPVVLDIAGPRLNRDDRRRLAHPLTGGMILFARHWVDRRQLTALVAEAKAIRPDLLVCVDHEGGRVQRFRTDGFTHLPPMRVLGAELRACGVDLSFTPVLDLDHGPSGVIGDRAFHRDPRVTALLAKSLMHGLLRAGMANCGKHFPGHGYVAADSHVDVPVDRRLLKSILDDDAKPYEWLSTSLTAVMPAHVVYPKVDKRPAGFSERWLQDILRGKLGFTGAIFSDDLTMEGARHLDGHSLSYADAATLALQAGCDMVLMCNQSQVEGGRLLDELLDGLQTRAADGRWAPDVDSEARRQSLLPQTAPWTWDELMREPVYQQALNRLP